MKTFAEETTGLEVPKQGENGYHQCWYAVAMSSEVPAGQVVGKEFLDGRIVVWRSSSGQVAVQSAYCRHLGADLSVGEVDGDVLRCDFHHWEYGLDGRCSKIPVTDRIPQTARLYSFAAAERWGLIWAFNGEEPLYDLPEFPTLPEEQIAHRVFEIPPLPVDPYVIVSNTQDFQHVAVMHGATMEHEPATVEYGDYTVEFENDVHDPTLGEVHQHFKLFGTNTLTLSNRPQGTPIELLSLFTATPTNGGKSKGYTVTGTRNDVAAVEEILDRGEHFARTIMEDDNLVLETIRFKPDVLIPADGPLIRWLQYAQQFPNAHPSRPYIR